MTSEVRVDVPAPDVPTTRSLRENFATIKRELEALQDIVFGSAAQDSPVFSGTTEMEDATVTGTLTADAIAYKSTITPSLTVPAPLSNASGSIVFTKYADGTTRFAGKVTFDYTNIAPGNFYQIIALDGLASAYRPDPSLGGGTVVHPIVIFSGAFYYTGMLAFYQNGKVDIGFPQNRNTVSANVTAVAADAYCFGFYDSTGSV